MASRFRRYIDLIPPGERSPWVGVVVLALVVSGLEAIGAVLVYTLVGLATESEGTAQLPVFGDLRDRFPDVAQQDLTVATALGVAVFFGVRALIVLGTRYYQDRVAQMTGVALSTRLLERYLWLPYAFHLTRNSSKLVRNTNESVSEILTSVLQPLVNILSSGLVVVAMLVVLLATAPLATLVVAAVITPIVLIVLRVVRPRMKRLGRISQQESARSYESLQHSLHGYRDITVLGRQDFFLDAYRRSRVTIAETRWKRGVLGELPRVSIEAVVMGFIAAFVSLSTVQGGNPQESLAVLGLFAYAALRIMPALNKVVSSLTAMRFGRAALDDVQQDLALPVTAAAGSVDPLPFDHAIHLRDVSFRYEGVDAPTMRRVDLEISRGESLGVVGFTGAGKSTLIDLIVGLSTPTEGSVTVDGVDIRGREAAWQRNIGMVSQQVFLVDDTLRRNIALGYGEEEIDEDRVLEAVHLAQLDEFVAALPEGLATTVGERGVRVSGGQRQRVAIARALYHRPSVLIFDEGTSALDNVTELLLIEALAQLRAHHTIITVAHRLSTVRDYDRIALLADGELQDVGTFDALLERNEGFRNLAGWSGVPRA
ncbi:ABC transporter ATP-binding protein [soil metagenome]